ncbi:MAG TPA: hypothetical protein VF074_09670 [Pyrinomonadaceae bacterium]
MLAYIFWHWPQSDVDPEVYRTHLAEFHETLARNKPPGFHNSTVFQISNPPWLDTPGTAFEDWYLVENSAALDPLNDGAVSGACEESHNRVAREAADGTAGLYRLRSGTLSLAEARNATWFSKPPGMSYQNLYDSLQSVIDDNGAALWGRQMTLGPTTEFCVLSPMPIKLPNGIIQHQLALEVVWSGG